MSIHHEFKSVGGQLILTVNYCRNSVFWSVLQHLLVTNCSMVQGSEELYEISLFSDYYGNTEILKNDMFGIWDYISRCSFYFKYLTVEEFVFAELNRKIF